MATHTKPFETERDLIETTILNLNKFVHNPTSYVASTEVEIGEGRVDIIVGQSQFSQSASLVQRLTKQNSDFKLKGTDAVVLSHLYLKKPIKITTLSRKSGIEPDVINDSLKNLMDMGLCTQPGEGTYLRTPISEHLSKLISIEGKLRNWHKALLQAHRNRLFSTYSYVVIDKKYSAPAIKNLDRFRQLGVGLAVASQDTSTIEIILAPRTSKPVSNTFFLLAKEALTTKVQKTLFGEIDDLPIFSTDIYDAIHNITASPRSFFAT